MLRQIKTRRRCKRPWYGKPVLEVYMGTIPQEQTCSRCKQTKFVSLFPVNKNALSGYGSHCRECANLDSKEYRARRRSETSIKRRQRHYLQAYDISLRDYFQMLETQQGCCAICQTPAEHESSLFVDHNHTTGIVRGLLCPDCNKGIGFFRDNPSFLEQAARYVAYRK